MLTEHGVPIAPATYYVAKPRPPPLRPVRGAQLTAEVTQVWKENFEVYGAGKVWSELSRQGHRGGYAFNTKTSQVREPKKINTGTTRTKRHYPAHGNTAANMIA